MDNILKNSDLIISEVKEEKVWSITIKKYNEGSYNNETRLGDVLNALPNGLIHKTETGMGATTLELTTHRNSIIVEPIKITASSKAAKHNALYVGSPTQSHPIKITKKKIQEYVTNTEFPNKKIVVVADSLTKVIEAIGESVYSDFFLLIDEVDSFQLDSSYRKSMEECIDYYKDFDPSKRALVSATPLDFSDDKLSDEPITSLSYDTPSIRQIKIFYTNYKKIQESSTAKIIELLEEYPDDKIMVAYNSVSGCLNIANHLVGKGFLPVDNINILCSNSSSEKVGSFYRTLESDILPSKLNFVTSAYFTGFDLNEKYHLVSISGNLSRVHALSEYKLKQIAGRCRLGLLSETIIHDNVPDDSELNSYTKEDLVKDAIRQIGAINCIRQHFKDSALLRKNHSFISSTLVTALDNINRRLIRLSNNDDIPPTISYLNIDALLENNRVRNELYLQENALTDRLREEGNNVISGYITSYIEIAKTNADKVYNIQKNREVIELLRGVTNDEDLRLLEYENKNLNTSQKKLVKSYRDLYQYIQPESLLDKMESLADKNDSRKLNNLLLSASFLTLSDDDNFKSRVMTYFPIGCSLTKDVILERWKHVFTDTNQISKIKTTTQAVRLLKTLFKCKKNNNTLFFKVIEPNPYKFELIRQRPSVLDSTAINNASALFNTSIL